MTASVTPGREEVIRALKSAHLSFLATGAKRPSEARWEDMADSVIELYRLTPTPSDPDAINEKRVQEDAKLVSNVREAWAFAKQLSNALLKIRPLGDSELFVKRNGDYYADPDYCGHMIVEMREALHQARVDKVRLEKAALSTGEPKR